MTLNSVITADARYLCSSVVGYL